MLIKFLPFLLLFSLVWIVNAPQAKETTGNQRQVQAEEKKPTSKKVPPVEKIKQSSKNKPAFIPSEQVSPDVPVSFPADI